MRSARPTACRSGAGGEPHASAARLARQTICAGLSPYSTQECSPSNAFKLIQASGSSGDDDGCAGTAFEMLYLLHKRCASLRMVGPLAFHLITFATPVGPHSTAQILVPNLLYANCTQRLLSTFSSWFHKLASHAYSAPSRAQMKEHVYELSKCDYLAFITEYVRVTASQYGPAPPDDVQRKLVHAAPDPNSNPIPDLNTNQYFTSDLDLKPFPHPNRGFTFVFTLELTPTHCNRDSKPTQPSY